MPLPFTSLLVSTDFSPLGDAAIPIAFRLAKDQGARVLLVSVLETPVLPSPLYAHYYPIPDRGQLEQARAVVQQQLTQRVPKEFASVPHEVIVGEGEPAGEIARLAREHGASAVVIATHGRTGIKHFMLGSVAERVVKSTSCPILLVR